MHTPDQQSAAHKPWLKNYPPDVPAEIDPDTYRSLGELFEKSAAAYRTRPAYASMGTILNYGAVERLSRNFAAYIQTCLGLRKGERIALMLPNVLQYPVCLFGALRAGLIVVNVNPLYSPRELEHQLRDSGTETIVIAENFAHVLERVIARTPIRHVIVTRLGDLLSFPKSVLMDFAVKYIKHAVPAWNIPGTVAFKAVLKQGTRALFNPVAVTPDDIAFLQYTGGTTGISKGAMLTHRNLIANLEQTVAWCGRNLNEGTEIVVSAPPLYHILGLTANCLMFTKIGGMNLLIIDPRDIPGFVRQLRNYPFTVITGVNTLFNALLHNADFVRLDFGNLRFTLGGGMAVQSNTAERWKRVTGCTISQAYGLTETSPGVCISLPTSQRFDGSVGPPIPSTEVRIRDADGRDLPPKAVGEIFVRGPQVMKGYWNHPEETAMVLGSDGFFATGDIGFMDDEGFLTLVERKSDMIIVSGFNVYPTEIESIVTMHPGVGEVAAVGVPDNYSGESVKLYVVKKDPTLTEGELERHCRANLTGYKVPRQIEFRGELPKSNVGKILRRMLRDARQG